MIFVTESNNCFEITTKERGFDLIQRIALSLAPQVNSEKGYIVSLMNRTAQDVDKTWNVSGTRMSFKHM